MTKIIITEIRGDQVRIGIHAPRDIAVHRRDIYDELAAESQAAKIQSFGSPIPGNRVKSVCGKAEIQPSSLG